MGHVGVYNVPGKIIKIESVGDKSPCGGVVVVVALATPVVCDGEGDSIMWWRCVDTSVISMDRGHLVRICGRLAGCDNKLEADGLLCMRGTGDCVR